MTTTPRNLAHLQDLLPPGAAWPRDPDATLTHLLAGLAGELDRVEDRTADLRREADPRTTLELLPEWERVAGLPDGCLPANTSLSARRAALIARLTDRGGQHGAYYQGLADLLGVSVALTEWRPFTCGWSPCGASHQIGPPEIRHVWQVTVTEPRVAWWTCGLSQAGLDPLARIERAAELECLLARLRPAHSRLLVSYTDGMEEP